MLKELLLKLYLLPANKDDRLARSIRKRISKDQHLSGLAFILNNHKNNEKFGKTIVDVGCFEGGTSLYFQKKIKGVNVIGFEASTQSYNKAVENTKGNTSIKIENYALSDFSGKTKLYLTDNKVSSSLNPLTGSDDRFSTVLVEEVNTITIDEYFASKSMNEENILAIKLDVQGHELKVLKGAENTLKRILFVLTELSNHDSYEEGAHYYEVDQLLRQSGFKLHNIFAPFSYDQFLYEFDALYINQSLSNKFSSVQ